MKNLTKPRDLNLQLRENITRRSLKWIGWSIVLIPAFYFVFKYALPYFTLTGEFSEHHIGHYGWLLLHIAGGISALLLGPIQFWTALRRKFVRIHRLTGRFYLGSVGISAAASVYILTLPESSFGFRLGISGLALAWISTTALAYLAVLKRQIDQHREWMIRSYVVTFGFVFFRLLTEPMFALEVATPQEIISAASWLCWAVPLLITEVFLQGRKIFHRQKGHRPA